MNKKTLFYFISCQISYIRNNGGLPVLFKKTLTFLLSILTMPLVLILRVLKRAIIIRFGVLPSERIGHFALNVELYLCERDKSMHNPRNFDIFYYNSQISNYQLMKMWGRVLRISNSAKFLDKANRLLPGGEEHVIDISSALDIHGFFNHTPPHLSFTSDEERLGKEGLQKLGIGDNAPFICFHARDSIYLDTVMLRKRDWRYHSHRNSKIHNYISAAKEMTRRGYFTIRMGHAVKEAIKTENPKIIDYAVNSRTDFMDIFLGAKCRFFISSGSGIDAIPEIFRRPVAFVNFIPIKNTHTWYLKGLFIPKKLRLRKEDRFLTFKEILNSEVGGFLESRQYEQRGIDVIENSPEEILALVIETDERLKGTWKETDEDKLLQKRFWSLFKTDNSKQVFLSHIGAEFLRQNQSLLE